MCRFFTASLINIPVIAEDKISRQADVSVKKALDFLSAHHKNILEPDVFPRGVGGEQNGA